jgi:hypothetical protein
VGAVFVDFGEVLQMVQARVSNYYQSDLGSACTPEVTTQPRGNGFSVLGFVLEESVDTITECEDGADCTPVDIPGLTVTVENSPPGTFSVVDSRFIVDPRAHCQPETPDFFAEETLPVDLDNDGNPEYIVPANICGIPRAGDGIPQIWVQNIESDLEEPWFDQIVDIEVQNPENPDFFCAIDGVPNTPYMQPLQAWVPRNDGSEVPVLVDGERSNVVQDVTTQCGSYKGKTRALSYLVGNMRYVATETYPDFHTVVSAELDRLDATIASSSTCVSGTVLEALEFASSNVRMAFDMEQYEWAANLLHLISDLLETGLTRDPLLSCQFDLDTDQIVPESEEGPNIKPALIYGYLEAQIKHLIFQMENKFQE